MIDFFCVSLINQLKIMIETGLIFSMIGKLAERERERETLLNSVFSFINVFISSLEYIKFVGMNKYRKVKNQDSKVKGIFERVKMILV